MTRASGLALAVTVAFFFGAVPSALCAQSGWAVDLAAGRAIHDPVSSSIGTSNLSLGLRYGDQPGWFYLTGGLPLSSRGVQWGAAGLGGRIARGTGTLSVGVDLGAYLFGYSDTEVTLSGGGAILEALPMLALARGAAALELRSGILHYTGFGADSSAPRQAHDSGIRVTFSQGTALSAGVEGRYLRVPEGGYPYAGGTLQFAQGRTTVWATAGRWLDDEIPTLALGGGVGLTVDGRTDLQASWQQEPNDPLYWNLPRRSWAVQVSRRFGRSVPATPLVPVAQDGRVTIRIPLSSAPSAPFVVGDFTGWQPVPMSRSGEYWTVSLPIAPGTYHYGFKQADGRWFIPPTVPQQVDDGMGGTSALLVVP